MDQVKVTTRKPRKNRAGKFNPRSDADERIASAKQVIYVLLGLTIHKTIKRSLLNEAIWHLTLAEGSSKYRSRYRTKKAIEQETSGVITEKLQHDHVYQRKYLVDALLGAESDCDAVLAKAVGCTVTEAEHRELSQVSKHDPHLDGWSRYAKANITVIDTMTGKEVDFESM